MSHFASFLAGAAAGVIVFMLASEGGQTCHSYDGTVVCAFPFTLHADAPRP